ncbi:DUF3427 domain-containing protein [Nocardioides caricicola]|uniref:DUF3427 domain-containing protein n=1 Tax=Nocardioides caricicola TaxID=634770 RepID=A0ABW0N0M0_9ACTN
MPHELVAPGLRNELISENLREALAELSEGQASEEELSAADAIERLGKHLLRVARRLRTPDDAAELETSVGQVNDAISALGFDEDRVAVPPRILTGVRPALGLAQSLPAHPTVPLTSSELFVNGQGEPGLGKVLLEELRCADEVDLICAFVGYTGFEPLRDEFRKLIERGGRIRVITSTYLGSTSPKALDEFVRLGAQVKVNYQGSATKLHAKAWLFRRTGELDTAFIGSSNLSEAALFSGLEWNVRLARADAPGVFARIQHTFDSYWHAEPYESYSLSDRPRLESALAAAKGTAAAAFSSRAQKVIDSLSAELQDVYSQLALEPKHHQRIVLDRLKLRREEFDEHRHLVVAATGTGKTVMAALDYARLCVPGKPRPSMLFVAHREQILEQARSTFRKALRDPAFGEILTGSRSLTTNAVHVFAMVQTLHRRLGQFDSEAYQVVYIDEAHHGAAESWREVIQHLAPAELVGLTATPERTDGTSILDLFGGTYTTELRLWEAIDDQLLAPFEYVGIDDGTDLSNVTWRQGDYAAGELTNLYTADHERVKRIVEAIDRWVEHPHAMRALGFCVSVEHAQFMTEQFTSRGVAAEYLSGSHGQEHRDATLAKLKAGALQVVFSVEVLGEGVDVPDVDTLLLLRPTQSATLFSQQLGRGLRSTPGKARCLVLDFIGQHRAEYRHENRLRVLLDPTHGSPAKQIEADFPFLPSGCAMTLERVPRERILTALKAARARTGMRQLTTDLAAVRSTTLETFLEATGRGLEEFYSNDAGQVSWTRLQRRADLPNAPAVHTDAALSDEESSLLRRMSHLLHVADGYRVAQWRGWLSQDAPPRIQELSEVDRRSLIQLFHQLGQKPGTLEGGLDVFWRQPAVRVEIADLLKLTHAAVDVQAAPLLGLVDVPIHAFARYTRAEVFAALGVATVDKQFTHQSGTYFHAATQTQLMFVTLHKDDRKFSSSVQYRDYAISPQLFHWESPNNWRQDSTAMLKCIGAGPEGSKNRLLFVRERSAGRIDGTFRCFGLVDLEGELEGERPVGLTWRLRQRLPEAVFEATRLVATA